MTIDGIARPFSTIVWTRPEIPLLEVGYPVRAVEASNVAGGTSSLAGLENHDIAFAKDKLLGLFYGDGSETNTQQGRPPILCPDWMTGSIRAGCFKG